MSCGSAISSTISSTEPAVAFARPGFPMIPWREYLRAMTTALARYSARQAQRRALGELDDRLLADIGLSRQNAIAEARKPFWL
jgi:uncharacterized protein YjiS (DUF1127 family)